MKREIFSVFFALVLVFSFSLIPAMPAGAQQVPNPTFCTVNASNFPTLTTPSTEISIGWEREPNIPGEGFSDTDAIHVTTSVPTVDYAMVIVPTDFILGDSTGISYWGYTVTDSQVKAPDEIFFFLDSTGGTTYNTLLTSHKPGGLAEFYSTWDEWNSTDPVRLTKEGQGNEWHEPTSGNYEELVDPNAYSTARVLAIALTAGPSMTSGAVDVDVYFDRLTVNGDVLLDNNTGTIVVPEPFPGQLAPCIQDAVDAALPGTTINVAAGTYDELLTINVDGLTLLGAQADVDPRPTIRSGAEESIIRKTYTTATPALNPIKIEASNVTINGFTISPHYGDDVVKLNKDLVKQEPQVGTNWVGTTIKYNILTATGNDIVNNCDELVQLKGVTGAVIEYNYGYHGIAEESGGNAFNIADGSADSVIRFNEAYRCGDFQYAGKWGGAIYTYKSTNISVIGNKVVEGGGITFGASKATKDADWPPMRNVGGTVEGNIVEDATFGLEIFADGATVSGNDATGCSVYALNIIGSNVTVQGNNLCNSGTGILVEDKATVTSTGVSINANNIYGNTFGLNNLAATEVDATNNWWGDATGPKQAATNSCASGDEVSANVVYTPWLDAAYPGGNPRHYNVQNTTTSDTYNCIQSAINAALPGDTINVAAGTYDEQVVIDKQLTLNGANADVNAVTETRRSESIVYGETSTAITISAGDVIVDGFTLDGGITLDDTVNPISGGTISNNIITGADNPAETIKAENGIRVGWDYGVGVDGVTIKNNTISDSLCKGIRFANTKLVDGGPQHISNITISGNEIKDNGSAGMETYGPGPNTIINNIISGNEGNGINLKFDDGDVVTGNIITNNTGPGITLRDVTNSVVENNSISGHVSPDVFKEFESGGGEGSKGSGIHIVFASENNSIRFNDISGNNYGIFIHRGGATDKGQPSGNSINFNNIYGNTYDGKTYGILNALVDPLTSVDATNNWWGTKAKGLIKQMVSDNVDYDPWIGAKAKESKSKKTAEGDDTVSAKDKTDTDVLKKGKGKPTITVTEYTDNPGDGAPGGFTSAGKYIDVHIDDPEDVDEIEIRNYYTTDDIAGLDEASLKLSWWDGTAWIECSDSGVNTADTDGYSGYVWAKIRETGTIPTLADMAGTPFMSMGKPPAPAPPPVGGGGGGGPPPAPTGTTDVRGMVSTAGVFYTQVTAISEDRLCRLTIPGGTVGLTEELEPLTTITMLIMADPPTPPEAANVIGLVYDFKPSGATFDPPVTLTFSYDPDNIPEGVAEEDLVLAYYDEAAGEWLVLDGCQVNPAINTITAPLSHFTAFGVLFIPTPAAFSLSSLEVSPAEAEIGDTITITAVVENTGEVAGTCQVALKVNGQVEEAKYVVVDPGASSTVSFTTSREAAGSYSVEVDGLVGSFTVTEKPVAPAPPELAPAPAPPPAKPINWPLIGGIIAAVVAGFVIFFLIRRKVA